MTSTAASAASRAPEGVWFKSSYSNPNGNQCVEVFFDDAHVHVRDSKDQGAGPVLTVPVAEWAAFLELVAGRASAGPSPSLRVTPLADGGADLTASTSPGITLTYTAEEWRAFVNGVHNGEFEHPAVAVA